MDGWKMIFPFGMAYFQGNTLVLGSVSFFKNGFLAKKEGVKTALLGGGGF